MWYSPSFCSASFFLETVLEEGNLVRAADRSPYNPLHNLKEPESIKQWAGDQPFRQDATRSEAE